MTAEKTANKDKDKAKVKITNFKKDLFKDCMTGCSDSNDVCYTKCTTESGADVKDKGKMKLKYEKEALKGDIDTCVEGGSTKKQCLKTQFTNNSSKKDKKKVTEAIKASIYEFIESAVELNEGDSETVKSNILAELKTFCETEMGMKRVNEKFLIKMAKNVACNK